MRYFLNLVFLLAVFPALGAEPDIYKFSDSSNRMSKKQAADYLECWYLFSGTWKPSSMEELDGIKEEVRKDVNVKLKVLDENGKFAGGYYSTKEIYSATHHGILPGKKVEVSQNDDGSTKTPEPERSRKWLYIRKSTGLLDSDFSVSKDKISGEEKGDGAMFSYNRSFETGSNEFTAQGVVETPYEFTSESSENSIQEIWLVPAVAFNRLTGNDVSKDKELNSLSFNLGTFLVADYDKVETSLFRAGAVIESDFDFKSLIIGGEAEYELVNHFLDLGVPIPEFEDKEGNEVFSWMQRLVLHMDGGEICDAGDKTTIKAGETYVRLGPEYVFDIFPGPRSGLPRSISDKMKLEFSYGHYIGIVGRAFDDYQASLNLGLDSRGIFGISIAYEHGGLNANGDKADQITAGITIKQ